MRDRISCDVTPVAVHDEKAACLEVLSLVAGSKTVVSRSYAWISDVQPLLLVENRQSRDVWAGIQAVLVCCASKIIKGDMAAPAAVTHSMAVIHSCRPAMTSQLDFSQTLTNALSLLTPTANPYSSML